MSKVVSQFEGGVNCNYGQCQCKNKAGMRCGLCAQAGTRFCHLHQGCMDMAVAMDFTPNMPGKVWVQIPAMAVAGVKGAIFPESAGKLTKGGVRKLVSAPGNSSDMLKLRTQQLIKAYSGSLSETQINSILEESVKSVGSGGGGVGNPLSAVAKVAAAAVGAPIAAAAAAAKAVAEAFTPEEAPAYFNEEKGIFEPLNKVAAVAARGPKAPRVIPAVRAQSGARVRNPCERIISNYLTAKEKATKTIGSVRKANLAREISSDPNTGVTYGQVINCLASFAVVDDR